MRRVKKRRWLLAAAVLPLILAACTSTAGRQGPGTSTTGTVAGSGSAAPGGLRAVRHVWVIELENQGYQQSFGTPSADPYLARTLPRMGALLESYYGIGHSSAANYIALVSGQAPSLGTQADCPLWTPFPGQVMAGPYHQALGEGCVYPAAVPTLGNQLSAAGRSWAAYLQDMGNDPARDNTVSTARGPACGHPATGAIDHTQKAAKGDQYAARHDGFTFFRSVTANQAFCAAHILSFRPLPGNLARRQRNPGVLLHRAGPVQRRPRRAVRQWRPRRPDAGRRVPVPVGAEDHGRARLPGRRPDRDHLRRGQRLRRLLRRNRRHRPGHPNVPLPGRTGPGGGRIGAVVLSPLIRPATVSTVAYNHYSLLRSIEDIFGLPHLGDAAMPQVRSFGPDVFG